MSQGCQQTRPSEREEFNAKTPHHSIPMTRHRCALNPEKISKQEKKKKKPPTIHQEVGREYTDTAVIASPFIALGIFHLMRNSLEV
jgi:hypothetical protein